MKILKFAIAAVACAPPALACDFCAIYSAIQTHAGKGFFAGAAEQFTHFGTLQDEGQEEPNVARQYLDSSISQVFVGYNFNKRFDVQFNAPLIHRSFRRAIFNSR